MCSVDTCSGCSLDDALSLVSAVFLEFFETMLSIRILISVVVRVSYVVTGGTMLTKNPTCVARRLCILCVVPLDRFE